MGSHQCTSYGRCLEGGAQLRQFENLTETFPGLSQIYLLQFKYFMFVQHECRLLWEMEVVEYTQMDVLS